VSTKAFEDLRLCLGEFVEKNYSATTGGEFCRLAQMIDAIHRPRTALRMFDAARLEGWSIDSVKAIVHWLAHWREDVPAAVVCC
jgi:hypothetical protein